MVHACGAVKALRLLDGGVAPERRRRHSAQRVGPASCECGVGWGRIGGVVLMWHWEYHLWDCDSEMRYACVLSGDTWDGLGSWGVFFTCAADRGRSATALRYRLGDCSRRGVGGGRFWRGWEAHRGGR